MERVESSVRWGYDRNGRSQTGCRAIGEWLGATVPSQPGIFIPTDEFSPPATVFTSALTIRADRAGQTVQVTEVSAAPAQVYDDGLAKLAVRYVVEVDDKAGPWPTQALAFEPHTKL